MLWIRPAGAVCRWAPPARRGAGVSARRAWGRGCCSSRSRWRSPPQVRAARGPLSFFLSLLPRRQEQPGSGPGSRPAPRAPPDLGRAKPSALGPPQPSQLGRARLPSPAGGARAPLCPEPGPLQGSSSAVGGRCLARRGTAARDRRGVVAVSGASFPAARMSSAGKPLPSSFRAGRRPAGLVGEQLPGRCCCRAGRCVSTGSSPWALTSTVSTKRTRCLKVSLQRRCAPFCSKSCPWLVRLLSLSCPLWVGFCFVPLQGPPMFFLAVN